MEWRRFVTYLSNDPRISLDIAPLTILVSGALQPWKWQLTVHCSTAAQAVAAQSPR